MEQLSECEKATAGSAADGLVSLSESCNDLEYVRMFDSQSHPPFISCSIGGGQEHP